MATNKKPTKKRRGQKAEARARRRARPRQQHAAGSVDAPANAISGAVDRDVDESPEAVESRRESQSGPGATGVAHTGPAAEAHEATDADDHERDDEVAGASRPAELDPPGRHPHS